MEGAEISVRNRSHLCRPTSPPATHLLCAGSFPTGALAHILFVFECALQDADLLDEQEQREYVEAFERAAARSAHYSKALLSLLGVLVAVLYLFFGLQQLVSPWQTAHQARFRGAIRAHSLAAAELAGAVTALLAVTAVLSFPRHSWRKLLAGAAGMAALLAVFWVVAVLRVAHMEQVQLVGLWRLLWLPIVPPTFVGLMALACGTLGATDADLRRLRAVQYAYKRA
ncbi:hypothetical protein ABPG77_008668 [Micractinium sp. CCAP 211/92]